MTEYPYSAALVVANDTKAAAETLIGQILGRDATGEIGVPLDPTATPPGTHSACNAALTVDQYFAFLDQLWAPGSPGAAMGIQVFTTVTHGLDDLPGAVTRIPDAEAEGGYRWETIVVIGPGEPDPWDVHPLRKRWEIERVWEEVGLYPAWDV